MPLVVLRQSKLFPTRRLALKATDLPILDQIRLAGLPEPILEYAFATTIGRRWKFDAAWVEQRIAFEKEGGAFGNAIHVGYGAWTKRQGRVVRLAPNSVVRVGGRHNVGAGMRNDCRKYTWAAILGWTVVRATTDMIRDGEAIDLLTTAFQHSSR